MEVRAFENKSSYIINVNISVSFEMVRARFNDSLFHFLKGKFRDEFNKKLDFLTKRGKIYATKTKQKHQSFPQ